MRYGPTTYDNMTHGPKTLAFGPLVHRPMLFKHVAYFTAFYIGLLGLTAVQCTTILWDGILPYLQLASLKWNVITYT